MKLPLPAGRGAAAALLLTLGLVGFYGPSALAQTIDGTRDAAYGAALVLQTTATGFGDAAGGSQTSADGSELDGAYATISGGMLHLMLTGNLQDNGNKLEIFFDSKSGGQNAISATNTNTSSVNTMQGLTFDTGFAADYHLTIYAYQGGMGLMLGAQFVRLGAMGAGTDFGGDFNDRTRTLTFPASLGSGVGALSLDNSNGAGVDGANVNAPGAVTTGIELSIPLSALGATVNGGDIKVAAFVNGDGHNYASNQVLGGLPLGTGNLGGDGAGNFTGGLSGVNFNNFTGQQFFTVTNSVVVVTQPDISVTPTTTNYYNVGVGQALMRQVVVSNNGNAALNVTNITSSNGQFVASPTNFSVAQGASQVVNVTFTPTSAGVKNATLTVASNDPS